MGRKKVTLNNNPLEPQTIGKIKKHNFGFIAILFVMLIFGVVIFFLPELNTIYENYEKTGLFSFDVLTNRVNNIVSNNNSNTTVEPTNNTTNNTTTNEVEETTYLTLNTDTSVEFANVTFTGISYDDKQVKLSINSNISTTLVLSQYNYFIRLYDSNKELIKTHYFANNVNGSVNVNISVSNAVYYNIIDFKDNDYPYLLLDIDELNQSYLRCSRNNTVITYTFKDEKLSFIEDIVTVKSPSETTKSQYASLESNYEMIDGVEVTIEDGVQYRFIMRIDMQRYNGSIKNYYFSNEAYAREIKYKLEAMDFTCR